MQRKQIHGPRSWLDCHALDARGSIRQELQIMTLGDRLLEAGEYRLDFVKKLMVDPLTRRRFAPVMAATANDRGPLS